MTLDDLWRDLFGRVAEDLPRVLDGLDARQLAHQPAPGANSIGWLLWHTARMEDAQVAQIARELSLPGEVEVWHRDEDAWFHRFALPYPRETHGYGMSADDVAAFRVAEPALLAGYYAEVHQATLALLDRLDEHLLGQVVDRQWDPPVTAGVRLASIVNDATQHLGQAAYIRGLPGQRAR